MPNRTTIVNTGKHKIAIRAPSGRSQAVLPGRRERVAVVSIVYVIEWPEDDSYPRRWWHQTAGWVLGEKFATRFASVGDAAAERKRAMLDGPSTRITPVN